MPQLNIKDEETYRLVKQLAARRGTSATAAVRGAVREALDKPAPGPAVNDGQSPEERVAAILEWLREGAKDWPQHLTSKEMMDSLYDDGGLPI